MAGKPVLDDFQLQKVLGKGGYGKVMLVKHARTGDIYAMKTMRKENVVKRNQVQHTQSERNVLEAVSHPFIVSLHYEFQTH
jgi:protein-serine/threonine kinase